MNIVENVQKLPYILHNIYQKVSVIQADIQVSTTFSSLHCYRMHRISFLYSWNCNWYYIYSLYKKNYMYFCISICFLHSTTRTCSQHIGSLWTTSVSTFWWCCTHSRYLLLCMWLAEECRECCWYRLGASFEAQTLVSRFA